MGENEVERVAQKPLVDVYIVWSGRHVINRDVVDG